MKISELLHHAILGAALAAATISPVLADGSYPGSGPQPVGRGATGRASLTQNNLLFGNGTSPVGFIAPGTNGRCLLDTGTIWTPGFCVTSSGAASTGTSGHAVPFLDVSNTWTAIQTFPAGSIPNATLANSTISGVALGSNLGALTFGTHLAAGGASYNGSAGATISSDATSANTASTVVARDASGNFAAGTIAAALTGHASLDLALSFLGTNVQTALSANVGSAGAFVVNDGAGGTPSSITLTNGTGLPFGALPTIGAGTVLGSIAGGSPAALSQTQLTALINPATATLAGAFPAIGSLPLKSAPVGSDVFVIGDSAASGALKQTTLTDAIATVGAGVTSLNGQVGALMLYSEPQGRLTLVSGVPKMMTSQAGMAQVFYTPTSNGSIALLWNGTQLVPTPFTEVSQATTDTTKSPAAVVANSCYNEYSWSDAGTFRVTRGGAWTTTQESLTKVSGQISVNTNAITNGPGAGLGLYVGYICSNASGAIDWIFGAPGAGGKAASFQVWNAFNREEFTTTVQDSAASWTTTSVNTWIPAHASSTYRVSFLSGGVDQVTGEFNTSGNLSSGGGDEAVGIGLDTTGAPNGTTQFTNVPTSVMPLRGTYAGYPAFGQHYLQALEYSATNTATFWGIAGTPTFAIGGMTVKVWQ